MLLFSRYLTLLLGALVIVTSSAFLGVSGCSIQSADVSYAAIKNNAGFFNPSDVSKHMNFVMASNLDRYVQDGTSTLSCVDARSDQPLIGTPGGDLAEFAMGLYTYHELTNKVQDYASVKALFRLFMNQHVSASRPFYFHTDYSKLSLVFANVSARINDRVTVLPSRTPPQAELNVWLSELSQSYAQGCGHIRLMIEKPADYGLSPDARIIQWLIRAFYEELWAADTDAKRAKLAFVAKLGPLDGKAVAIVSNKQGTCSGHSPAIPPNVAGSSIFVYTPNAAEAFRNKVMSPFFAAQGAAGWNEAEFQSRISTLFNKKQLNSTLTLLHPANKCSLISIDATTVGLAPQSPKASASTLSAFGPLALWAAIFLLNALF